MPLAPQSCNCPDRYALKSSIVVPVSFWLALDFRALVAPLDLLEPLIALLDLDGSPLLVLALIADSEIALHEQDSQ